MTELLKFVHIATISVWAAGLVCLPFLFAQRKDVGHEDALHRLHAMVRFLYVVILSPTAFVAIGSGTALVFLRATFEPWFALKLLLVGLMVLIHIISGLLVLSLFDESARYSRLRYIVFTGGTLAIVSAILAVVLAKPEFDMNRITPDWIAPGQLSELAQNILGWDFQ
ncbi:CopD family protein [Pelagibacterium mangrovi]|uniref:CopD family protein n=1 Tax=Pelagibacterium mangrovi TaxID=3119828 RepID=UPI002FC95131